MDRTLPQVVTLAVGIAVLWTGGIGAWLFAPGTSPPEAFLTALLTMLGGLILIAIAACTWPRKEH